MTVEVAEALRRAGVRFLVMDDEWCAEQYRSQTNDEDRYTYARGMRGIADAEDVDREVIGEVASAIELAGGLVMFFDGRGGYLGHSTTHVEGGFYGRCGEERRAAVRRMGEDGPRVMPYEEWAVRYEELRVAWARAGLMPGEVWDVAASGRISEAEEVLLDDLRPATLFVGPAEAAENPPMPAAVAEVAGEAAAAKQVVEALFCGLYEETDGARCYVGFRREDEGDLEDLLSPMFVVLLVDGAEGARVAYEGEWLLERLAVGDAEGLRDLYEELRRAVEGEGE